MPVGRRPKPTAVKKLAGNPGRRPLNDAEPEAVAGLPECPAHLGAEARAEWARLGAQLVSEQRMALVYKAPFAAYCVAWGRWVEAEEQIQQFGLVIKAPSGYLVQSPYVAIANKAWAQMMKAVSELGISPTSQARVSVVTDGRNEEANPLQQLQRQAVTLRRVK